MVTDVDLLFQALAAMFGAPLGGVLIAEFIGWLGRVFDGY